MKRSLVTILLVLIAFDACFESVSAYSPYNFNNGGNSGFSKKVSCHSNNYGYSNGKYCNRNVQHCFSGPSVKGSKYGCDVEVTKTPKSSGQFGGFTDSFKEEMAYMISEITSIATPQAKALKQKIMNGLVTINRILNIINQYPSKQNDMKPYLLKEVKQFLDYLDDIEDLLSCQTNVTVIGNNNAAYANTGYIKGNNTTIVGNQNTAIGNSNIVVGNKSIVSGESNLVKGNNGLTVGKNNNVSANNTYTFSNGQSINQSNTLTIGSNTIDLIKLQNGKNSGYVIRD